MMDTSTAQGAREHARAQAKSDAARVRTQPTIPVSQAVDLPEGVDRDALVWDETLGPGSYASRALERGTRVRLQNLDGDACVQLLLYNADQPAERLNLADTIKVQWQAYLGEGALLLSDMGRVLASIVRDDCGRHDVFCGCSSGRLNLEKYGWGFYPSGRDRLLLALAKHGLTKRDLGPNVNLFKGVKVEPGGAVWFDESAGAAGECVELRAEMRLLLVIASTPHVLDPRPGYHAGPVRILAWRAAVTPEDDAVRNSSPERLRAFQNVEDYYCR
jgi:hypothetical protein